MKKAHGWQRVLSDSALSVCCSPRHRASGLGHGGLYLGSAFPASYSGARLQTEAERPVEQAYVLLMCSNECTDTHTHTPTHAHFHFHALCINTNLSLWLPNSGLSKMYFLSLSWINCIWHSREHIHTRPVGFRSVSIPSQWAISCFLSPRCTGAGEDGQVSFPTGCHTAVRAASKHSCSPAEDSCKFPIL